MVVLDSVQPESVEENILQKKSALVRKPVSLSIA